MAGAGSHGVLRAQKCALILIDLQERLLPAIAAGDGVLAKAHGLVTAARRLEVPLVVTEHYPDGLGETHPGLRARLVPAEIVTKVHFSAAAAGEDGLARHLAKWRGEGRNQLVVAGTEAHVCVLQSCLDLVAAGWGVHLCVDAVGSRAAASKEVAIARLTAAGAVPVTTEMVMFEWLGRGATDDFRALLPLIVAGGGEEPIAAAASVHEGVRLAATGGRS